MDELQFPKDIKTELVHGKNPMELFKPPTMLEWQLVDQGKVEKNKIVLTGRLTNTGSQDFNLIVAPYGGDFPYGGQSPFLIAIDNDEFDNGVIKYSGEMYPPEPPSEMGITIPAEKKVQFTASMDLGNYKWKGSPEITINWSFHYLNEPIPRGSIKIQLPKK